MKALPLFALVFLLIMSCGKEKPSSERSYQDPAPEIQTESNDQPLIEYAKQSTDPQTAANIKNFLINEFLKDDLDYLQEADRRFQFFKIDLNSDGKEEIFVRFMGPYFCGTGGCSFLLLDKYGEIITHFSVTRAPIYMEKTRRNDWSILLVKDSGVFKELIYENGSYPSNPSVLPKAPYDAPSGHAVVMFGDENFQCKTFYF